MRLFKLLFIASAIFATTLSYAQSDDLQAFADNQQARLDKSDADRVTAPNTNVKLAPPDDFVKESTINGFIHKGSSTSIQVITIRNAGYQSVTKALTNEYFQKQGFTLEKTEEMTLQNGEPAKLFITSFKTGSENYQRIFFFTGKENTIWINVNYPEIVKGLLYKPVISSLKTVSQG
jgi:hypothetical protein